VCVAVLANDFLCSVNGTNVKLPSTGRARLREKSGHLLLPAKFEASLADACWHIEGCWTDEKLIACQDDTVGCQTSSCS
jgi:hypothetical protein